MFSLIRELSVELPFVLVFGVATTVDAVHASLPHAVTSQLTMQKIASQSSIEILDNFLKSVITSSETPLKLGSHILQILSETFAFCDLSVKNVLTAYQARTRAYFSNFSFPPAYFRLVLPSVAHFHAD